jgi:vacuolar-type H+-ATPase subunit F/Vma7
MKVLMVGSKSEVDMFALAGFAGYVVDGPNDLQRLVRQDSRQLDEVACVLMNDRVYNWDPSVIQRLRDEQIAVVALDRSPAVLEGEIERVLGIPLKRRTSSQEH